MADVDKFVSRRVDRLRESNFGCLAIIKKNLEELPMEGTETIDQHTNDILKKLILSTACFVFDKERDHDEDDA